MQIASLVLGILALCGLAVGFFPCVGWYNWVNIPFAIVALIVSLLAKKPGTDNTLANGGVICSSIAIVAGTIRLAMGGGII